MTMDAVTRALLAQSGKSAEDDLRRYVINLPPAPPSRPSFFSRAGMALGEVGQGIFNSAKDAFMLPGRALYGEIGRPDEMDPREAVGEAMNFAGWALAPSSSSASSREISRASRTASMYNPPAKELRAFSADYPMGGVADDAGRLKFDIEGRPLVAEPGRIVGRRVAGGADEALAPAEFDGIAEAATGRSTVLVPPSALRDKRSAGEVIANRYSRQPELVQISNHLPRYVRLSRLRRG